jgi:peptidyl-prolyl cis-trans isomerase SDCCAG10
MSSVYTTEPVTSGRVILETSDGPLEIRLWCRECPHTTRLFLQLCLDGFYKDMVFHRIVNNFLIQTGALRHSSSEHASISMSSPEARSYREAIKASAALERRQYEVNSRIRFNHRGQVAMALGVEDADDVEDLQPQFFITLEDAPYLDGKHVCFGTISGPTVFNALRIGRSEVDENTHQPLDLPNATRILSAKIVENPIHEDLVPQPKVPWRVVRKESKQEKKKKRKGKYDTNVLSFGDEFDEENAMPKAKKGMQSSHDVVESEMLSKTVDEEVKGVVLDDSHPPENSTKGKAIKRQRVDLDDGSDNNSQLNEDKLSSHQNTSKKQDDNSISYEKKEIKPTDSVSQQATKPIPDSNKEKSTEIPAPKSSAVEARRLQYSKGKKSKKEREEETLAKLMAFRSTVKQQVEEKKSSKGQSAEKQQDDSLAARMARKAQKADDSVKVYGSEEQVPTYHGQVLESDDEDEDNGKMAKQSWLATSFKCRRHVDHDSRPDLGGDGRAADDYEVIDSRGKSRDKKHKSRKHHHGRKHHHRDDTKRKR